MTCREEDRGSSPSMKEPAQTADPSSRNANELGWTQQGRDEAASDSSVGPVGEPEIEPGTSPESDETSPVRAMYARLAAEATRHQRGYAQDAAAVSGGSDLPTSSTPGSQSPVSKTRWSKPSSAALLAAQANDVATRVLNGDIDLDTAARYASTARVAVSAMNIEVQRARAARQTPNLLLDNPIIDEDR